MANIKGALAYLYNGVSQQAPPLRHFSQGELLENAVCSVADGLRKRPPAIYINRLVNIAGLYPKVHHIFRSADEHYVVVIWDGTIKVYNGATGNEIAVDTSTYPGVLSYLSSTPDNPIRNIHCLTVADTTFITNRTKTVTTKAATISPQNFTVFIHIRQGAPEASYTFQPDGFTAVTYTTGTTAASQATTTIADGLRSLIAAYSGVTTAVYGNLITVSFAGAPFGYTMTDSGGGNYSTCFANRVQRYSDLPKNFVEGVTIEVKGDGSSAGASSYWVEWKSNAGQNTGYWVETVAPIVGEVTELEPTSMPITLVKLPGGTFRLERPNWSTRKVGSTATTAPVPSFVGQKINCTFFYRDRIGFLSDENVILSRANDLYNFWPKTGIEILDDDPIDVTVNASRVSILRHAVSFNRSLLLFSDNLQFQLSGGDILSPKTVRADVITEYSASRTTPPVSTGRDVFVASDKSDVSGSYGAVRQYMVDQSTLTNVAEDITAHVPQYVPGDVFRMSSSTTEDMVAVQAYADVTNVYLYQFLWQGDKIIQSAWNKWKFPGFGIIGAEFDRSTMWVTYFHTDGIHLAKIPLEKNFNDTGLPFLPHLDFRVQIAGSYNSGTNKTTFSVPYSAPVGSQLEAVTGVGFASGLRGIRLVLTRINDTQWTADGNWSAAACWVGYRYGFRYRFSQQYAKDKDGNAMIDARLQMGYYTTQLKDTGYVRAEVTAATRSTTSSTFTGLKSGSPLALLGTPVIQPTGKFSFPVQSRSDRVTVDLVNDSPYPSTVQAAEWIGTLARRV